MRANSSLKNRTYSVKSLERSKHSIVKVSCEDGGVKDSSRAGRKIAGGSAKRKQEPKEGEGNERLNNDQVRGSLSWVGWLGRIY